VPLSIVLGGHFDASRCSLVHIFGIWGAKIKTPIVKDLEAYLDSMCSIRIFFRPTLSLYLSLYIVHGGHSDASRCSLVRIFGIWGAKIKTPIVKDLESLDSMCRLEIMIPYSQMHISRTFCFPI
jgi:hypothetical protein